MNSVTAPDAQLVRDTLFGASEAFETLVERYFPPVVAIAYARLNNHADAEDAAQETFIRAYAKLDTLKDGSKFGGWVAAIARRTAQNARRPQAKAATFAETRFEPATPGDVAEREELHGLLREALGHLDETHREVLLLHYFAGRKTADIAELLGISQGAVLKRLQRGREALGTALLEDARDTFSDAARLKQRAKTVALAATASSPAWVSGAAAQGALGWGAIAKAAAVLVAGGAIAFGAREVVTDQHAVDAVAGPSNETSVLQEMAMPAPPDPVERQPLMLAADETDGAEPASETQHIPDEESHTEASASEPAELSLFEALNGTWRCELYAVGGDERVSAGPAVLVDLVYEPPDLTLTLNERRHVEEQFTDGLTGTGEVTDSVVTLNVELAPQAEGPEVVLEGPIAPSHTQMTLTGVIDGSVPDQENGTPVEAVFVRADEKMLSDAALRDQYMEEAQALLDAIRDWVEQRDGTLPDDLAALREEPETAALFAKKAGRTITYNPRVLSVGVTFSEDAAGFEPDLPLPERLLAWEQYLADLWEGDFVDNRPLLRVSYDDPAVRFVGRYSGGNWRVHLDTDEGEGQQRPPDPELREQYDAAQVASCTNNMKQLGIIARMFKNEFEGYYPPGWRTVYPEYLVDRAVLVCPSSDKSRMSYEVVFPARDEAYLARVAELVTGVADHGLVPFAIETHTCGHSDGRHVLYADGRVEVIPNDEWEQRVAPFLEYE